MAVTAPTDLAGAFRQARNARIQCARVDCAAFIEYAFMDERSSDPLLLQDFHMQWLSFVEQNRRAVVAAFAGSGKTTVLTVARTVHMLGLDSTLRVIVASANYTQAEKITRQIARAITHNPRVTEVFPNLRMGDVVRDGAFRVKRATSGKDFSVQAVGASGNLLGTRADVIILDDALDVSVASSPEARGKMASWYLSSLASRLGSDGRVVVCGIPFHPQDLLMTLSGTPGWASMRTPVMDGDGNPAWSSRWPADKIEERRQELGSVEFSRQMMCLPIDPGSAAFKQDWLEAALHRGSGRRPIPHLLHRDASYSIRVGVDLAASTKSTADLSAITVVLLHPSRDRELLWCEAGRWAAPETLRRVVSIHDRFRADQVVVEDVGVQGMIRDMLKQVARLPVVGFTTSKSKSLDLELSRMSVELERGQWIFPSNYGTPIGEVRRLVDDMLTYCGGHVPDRIASLLFARHSCERATRKMQTANWSDLGVR